MTYECPRHLGAENLRWQLDGPTIKPKVWFLALHILKLEFISTLWNDQVLRNQLMLTKFIRNRYINQSRYLWIHNGAFHNRDQIFLCSLYSTCNIIILSCSPLFFADWSFEAQLGVFFQGDLPGPLGWDGHPSCVSACILMGMYLQHPIHSSTVKLVCHCTFWPASVWPVGR